MNDSNSATHFPTREHSTTQVQERLQIKAASDAFVLCRNLLYTCVVKVLRKHLKKNKLFNSILVQLSVKRNRVVPQRVLALAYLILLSREITFCSCMAVLQSEKQMNNSNNKQKAT